jgi:hypothetical protein
MKAKPNQTYGSMPKSYTTPPLGISNAYSGMSPISTNNKHKT